MAHTADVLLSYHACFISFVMQQATKKYYGHKYTFLWTAHGRYISINEIAVVFVTQKGCFF